MPKRCRSHDDSKISFSTVRCRIYSSIAQATNILMVTNLYAAASISILPNSNPSHQILIFSHAETEGSFLSAPHIFYKSIRSDGHTALLHDVVIDLDMIANSHGPILPIIIPERNAIPHLDILIRRIDKGIDPILGIYPCRNGQQGNCS